MGIKVSEGGAGAVFFNINLKEGCLTQRENGVVKKFEPGRASLEGVLIKFVIDQGEYEDVKSETIRLVLRDLEPGQPNMHISMRLTTAEEPVYGAMRALGILNAADFSQPIEIKPYLFEKGAQAQGGGTFEKDFAGVSIKQGGESLKPDFMTADNKLPESPPVIAGGKQVMVNGRPVRDTTALKAHVDVLLDSIASRLPAMNPTQGDQQDDHGDDSVGVEEAAAAAAQVAAAPDRQAMRARG